MKFVYQMLLFLHIGSCSLFMQTHSMEQPSHKKDFVEKGALHRAIRRDDIEEVRILGKVYESEIFQAEFPLHLAVRLGKTEIVRILLDAGISVNKAYNRETPLHIAAHSGYEAIVKLLVSHGADLDMTRSDDLTALDLAIKNGHQGVVSLLIETKKDRREALEWKRYFNTAKTCKQTATYSLLQDIQKSIQSKSLRKRKDPESTASQSQSIKLQNEPLTQASAAVRDYQSYPHYSDMSYEQRTPLFLWFQTNLLGLIHRGDISGLRLARQLKINMNITYTNGRTALELAAFHRDPLIATEMVSIILPVAHIPDPFDMYGQTLSQIMLQNDRHAIVHLITEELIRRGEVPIPCSEPYLIPTKSIS